MLSELNEILSDLQYLSNINEADDAFYFHSFGRGS